VHRRTEALRGHVARGHPFAIDRAAFGERNDVVEVPIRGKVPLDVDTWDDYRAVLTGA
jgi:hypothetical protein